MDSALEVTLRTQGEIWFASRELGRLADTEPYFLNTALYYAFGLSSGRYVDTLFEPTYLEDTSDVADEIYVTPAAPTPSVEGEVANRITSTYNTSTDQYATINYSATEDPDADRNLPSYGRRRVLGHGNELRCYLLGRNLSADELDTRVPGYVRLGKKRGKAKVETTQLPVSSGVGEYQLGHPIGAYDTEQTPTGNLVTKRMRPSPIVAQATYEGEYVEIQEVDADADAEDECSVCLPHDVTFLKTKR